MQHPGKRKSGQIGKGGSKTGSRRERGHLQRSKNHRVSQGEEEMAETTPQLQQRGQFYQLSREDQMMMVLLRIGHCRLKHHLHTKLHIGDTDVCPCGMAPMTVEHLLQDCATHTQKRGRQPGLQKHTRKKICMAYWRICSEQRPLYEEPEYLSEISKKQKNQRFLSRFTNVCTGGSIGPNLHLRNGGRCEWS